MLLLPPLTCPPAIGCGTPLVCATMQDMRVEHLDGAPMAPPLTPPLPAHVLLCHTDDGLVLVDTGFGTADVAPGSNRIGRMRRLLRPVGGRETTVLGQLEERGLSAEDVTHVVLTHLDLDHAGGLSDFPHATVHTTADEHAAAITSPDLLDRQRYVTAQFAHGPRFALHDGPGDRWRDELTGHEVLPGIVLVPMPGHSRGHASVAVDAGERGWIVHAGDAVFDASQLRPTAPDGAPLEPIRTLRAFEMVVGRDRARIRRNHAELARLASQDDVTVVPAHDLRVLEALRGA